MELGTFARQKKVEPVEVDAAVAVDKVLCLAIAVIGHIKLIILIILVAAEFQQRGLIIDEVVITHSPRIENKVDRVGACFDFVDLSELVCAVAFADERVNQLVGVGSEPDGEHH